MKLQYWDIEDIIDETVSYLRDAANGLNTAITQVNAYKNAKDTAAGRPVMTLKKFLNASGAETITEKENLFYFFVSSEEMNNCDPIIVIGIPEISADDGGAETAVISYNILIEDNADGADPKRKALRYAYAIRAVLRDYLKSADMFVAAKLTNIAPDLAGQLEDNSQRQFYTAGVKLTVQYV